MKKQFKGRWALTVLGMIAILFVAGCSLSDKDTKNDSKKDYSKDLDYTITGIEPGAAMTQNVEKAMKQYDSLQGWEGEFASTGVMLTKLDETLRKKEPIIINAWSPHWMFSKHPELKYLKDPKDVFGGPQEIRTVVRKDLKTDDPNLYKLVDQFQISKEELEPLMQKVNEEETKKVVADWIKDNPDKVSKWTKGVKKVKDKSVEIVGIPWDSDRVNAGLMQHVMEDYGYEVKYAPVDPAVMYKSIATGDADVTFGIWMPKTQKYLYDKYDDKFEDLGKFLEGAKVGLAVPDYMDIDSIEDLKPKK